MVTELNRKARLALVLLGSLMALSLGLASAASSAQASTSNYCGGWLGVGGNCTGAARAMYQVYGWGDQGGVCVGIIAQTGVSCSASAGTGVYAGGFPWNVQGSPWIGNNSGVNNFVHGVALTY